MCGKTGSHIIRLKIGPMLRERKEDVGLYFRRFLLKIGRFAG